MVTLAIDERGGRTYARVELRCDSSRIAGRGVAYRHPSDYLESATGHQLATARAFSNLADQLLLYAASDAESVRPTPA